MGVLSKMVGKAILKDTKRGAAKEALKEEFIDKGMTELQATNKAHREMAKESGKKTAIEKVDVKQDRDTSKFKAADSKGGNKTLAVQARDLDSNKFVSMKRESDEGSTVRSVAERQKLREAGEKMYEAGVKEEVKNIAKGSAVAAVVGGVVGKELAENANDRNEKKKKEEEEMNKGGMVGKYAKGGMVVNKGIGASMKPHNVFGSKGKK
jgi:hypothetical protein